jgi:hypothetical protein
VVGIVKWIACLKLGNKNDVVVNPQMIKIAVIRIGEDGVVGDVLEVVRVTLNVGSTQGLNTILMLTTGIVGGVANYDIAVKENPRNGR